MERFSAAIFNDSVIVLISRFKPVILLCGIGAIDRLMDYLELWLFI